MTTSDMEHSIFVSHTPSLSHPQICAVNVKVFETYSIKAEVAPGDFQVLDMDGHPEEYSIPSIFFSFDTFRSTRCYNLFEHQLLLLQPCMHPKTRLFLVENVVEHVMKLVSSCSEDDISLGYVVDARLDVEYFRVADEEELAPYRLFDEMDAIEDEMDDEEANQRFIGVEKGRYNGGDGKEEVITCSVCLEDLKSGMEFNKLPCSHIFHGSCTGPWFERNRSCPNCRNKVEGEDGVWLRLQHS